MEIEEIFDGNKMIQEARQKQVFFLLRSLSILSSIPIDEIHNRFLAMLDECVRDFRKSSRVYDGEDIINQIFNEKES